MSSGFIQNLSVSTLFTGGGLCSNIEVEQAIVASRSALSRHSTPDGHAALRPVIPDMRSWCKIESAPNWWNADISATRLTVSKERFQLFIGIRESIGLGNIAVTEDRKWTAISTAMQWVRVNILVASPVAQQVIRPGVLHSRIQAHH